MSKKKRSKKKNNSNPVKATDKNPQVEKEEEKQFDFGGMPNRDLKKNLGCG